MTSTTIPDDQEQVFDGNNMRDVWRPGDGHGSADSTLLMHGRRYKTGHTTWKIYCGDIPASIDEDSLEPPHFCYLDDKALWDVVRSNKYTKNQLYKYWPFDFSQTGTIKNHRRNRGRAVYKEGLSKQFATYNVDNKKSSTTYIFKGGPLDLLELKRNEHQAFVQPPSNIRELALADAQRAARDGLVNYSFLGSKENSAHINNGPSNDVPNDASITPVPRSPAMVPTHGNVHGEAPIFNVGGASYSLKRPYENDSVVSSSDDEYAGEKRVCPDATYIEEKYLGGMGIQEQVEELKKLLASAELVSKVNETRIASLKQKASRSRELKRQLHDAKYQLQQKSQELQTTQEHNDSLQSQIRDSSELEAVHARLTEAEAALKKERDRATSLDNELTGVRAVSAANLSAANRHKKYHNIFRHLATTLFSARVDQSIGLADNYDALEKKAESVPDTEGLRTLQEIHERLMKILCHQKTVALNMGLSNEEWTKFHDGAMNITEVLKDYMD